MLFPSLRSAGISAWVACAMAMAAGEYVSVASQKVGTASYVSNLPYIVCYPGILVTQ